MRRKGTYEKKRHRREAVGAGGGLALLHPNSPRNPLLFSPFFHKAKAARRQEGLWQTIGEREALPCFLLQHS